MDALHLTVHRLKSLESFQLLTLGLNGCQLFVETVQTFALFRHLGVHLQVLVQLLQLALQLYGGVVQMCQFGLAEAAPLMNGLHRCVVQQLFMEACAGHLLTEKIAQPFTHVIGQRRFKTLLPPLAQRILHCLWTDGWSRICFGHDFLKVMCKDSMNSSDNRYAL